MGFVDSESENPVWQDKINYLDGNISEFKYYKIMGGEYG